MNIPELKDYLNNEILKIRNIVKLLPTKQSMSIHEYIIHKIADASYFIGAFPIFEYRCNPHTNHRIDIVWVNPNNPQDILYAFEVEKTVKPHSIKKLQTLPENTVKAIVSISHHHLANRHYEYINQSGINHIDLTLSL